MAVLTVLFALLSLSLWIALLRTRARLVALGVTGSSHRTGERSVAEISARLERERRWREDIARRRITAVCR